MNSLCFQAGRCETNKRRYYIYLYVDKDAQLDTVCQDLRRVTVKLIMVNNKLEGFHFKLRLTPPQSSSYSAQQREA